MTLWRHLRKGALRLIHKCGFWKGDPDITLVFNRSQAFPIYLTFNGLAGYDVIVLFPLVGGASDSWIRFWKDDPDFIWCLIVTIRLPCTVSDVIRCYFQPEMTSQCQLRRGTLQFVSVCEFWKGHPDFIFLFNGNNTSIIHRVRYNQVYG